VAGIDFVVDPVDGFFGEPVRLHAIAGSSVVGHTQKFKVIAFGGNEDARGG